MRSLLFATLVAAASLVIPQQEADAQIGRRIQERRIIEALLFERRVEALRGSRSFDSRGRSFDSRSFDSGRSFRFDSPGVRVDVGRQFIFRQPQLFIDSCGRIRSF